MCRAASFRVEDSFASASHWLLTRTAFSPWRGCSLVPGGGEDRYGRGGLSEGRLSCRPPRVYGGVGRASLSTLACPVPQLLYRGWARMVAAGSQLAGSPC